MKKIPVIFLLALIVCSVIMSGCAKESVGKNSSSTQPETESTTEESIKIENDTKVIVPLSFVLATEKELDSLPDAEALLNEIDSALDSIGVQEIVSTTYGNYEKTASIFWIDVYVVTDLRKLIIEIDNIGKKWSVTSIEDYENGNKYYPTTAENVYDYISGEPINPEEETEPERETQPETEAQTETEETTHRDGIYGISDKDIHDVDGTFRADRVRNDKTGKWKISTIAANINMEEYALSYYKWKFYSDDEVHGIVNFNYRTTTCITTDGYILYVDVHEYVAGEEHDANLLFSGMLLKQYFVYLDNGDIEEIQ